jgi:Rrf2 family protein
MVLSRRALLAIAAVVDVSLHGRGRPVSAKALASRQALPPRHLEPMLQALVRDGILKGVRGPRGGYELGREGRRISADDILRVAGAVEGDADNPAGSPMLSDVVLPAMAQAQRAFAAALGRITIEELARKAESLALPANS